jgi:osmoprotectant transport system ATP-binding protein
VSVGIIASSREHPGPQTVPAIEFRDVTYSRPGGARVLDRLNLAIEPGDVLALVGRSGAGKSTLLKLVNRLLLPDSGAVLVDGRDTRTWDGVRLRRSVGYVIQDVGLFPHMTVGENIGTVPRLEAWRSERIQARVAELLDLIGLAAAYADRWPDELSGGQRQRVGVARALAADPPVLLMDEPFGALDPVTRAELQAEFRRIQARLHKTVIIVTHDMGEAIALGDRLGVLEEGRLLICDRPDAVLRFQDPRVRRLLDTVNHLSGRPDTDRAH